VLGLIPLAYGGNELFVPMARLMIVGLLVAMIINLILVPIIYDMFENRQEHRFNEFYERFRSKH